MFSVSELRTALAEPGKAMDPKIRVKPRTQAKRRAWLGVEYVAINKDLAEKFSVSKETKDGQIGFVINTVYPDSPAENFGLKVGDILLRGQAKVMPYPFELHTQYISDDSPSYWGGYWGPSEDDELGPAEAIWSNRKNFLTQAMDAIGVGKELKVWYIQRDGDKGGEV